MKIKRVVAGIIIEDKKVLGTQRGHGEFKGFWEFPGGKIEKGETKEEALVREMKEELGILVAVGEKVLTISYDYKDFRLEMDGFFCKVIKGDLQLLVHMDSKWLTKETIDQVTWLPADLELIEKLKKEYL